MRAIFVATICVLAVSLSFQKLVADEPYTLTIPGQGWLVEFTAPPLLEFQGQTQNKSFIFQGVDRKGFNLSMFVEEPKNSQAGHEACFDFYWPKAKRNPLIDPTTVKIDKTPKFTKVTYQIKAGDSFSLNVNYYFAFQHRWIDLHVSKFPPAPEDEQKLTAFEKSIAYKTIQEHTKPK
jgi:hypothetical protein